MASRHPSKKQILHVAMKLAEQSSWEDVHLHDIADYMQISLRELQQTVRDKDDLVIAWFDQADKLMLAAREDSDFANFTTRDKLKHLIFVWLQQLGKHKNITKQMIGGQIEPGHIQVVPAILARLKRTAGWLQEAAAMDTDRVKRMAQEAGLSSILMATFFCWLLDDSQDSEKTEAFLNRALTMAEQSSFIYDALRSKFVMPGWSSATSKRQH